jgi:DNA-directed RNA polymerase specialized sigma24 family protein
VLTVLVRKPPRFRHSGRPGAFRSWLRNVTLNELSDFLRRRAWLPALRDAAALDALATPADALARVWDEEYDRHVLSDLLDLVKDEFAASTWRAFRRVALEGAAPAAVAAETGLTVNAVAIAKSRVLKALETRHDPRDRRAWKFRPVRGLYERGFRNEDVRQLFRVIDWLMELPPRLQEDFWQELEQYEEGRKVPYVTSVEREGMFKLIKDLLRAKFGAEAEELLDPIHDLNDAEKYKTLNRVIASAATLDEVRRACVAAGARLPRRKKGGNGKRGSKT